MLTKLQKEAQNIRLSEHERRAMHARIFGAPTPYSVESPYTYFFAFTYQRAFAFAAVLLLVLGSTTTYAAGGSVPGDLLYSVKVDVNEPLREKLALSNGAKLLFHTAVAQERFKEAEILAAEGKLDEEAALHIEASVESHIAQANSIAAELEGEEEAQALEASVILDSSISAHGKILATIGGESHDKDTKEYSRSLSQRSWSGIGRKGENIVFAARGKQESAMTMSLAVEDRQENSQEKEVSEGEKRLVKKLEQKAEAKVEEAKEAFEDAQYRLAATTTLDIENQLSTLRSNLEVGKKERENEEYADAKATFTAVLEDAVELSAYIEASAKFKHDFVGRDWWGRDDDSWDEDRWDDEGEKGEDEDDHSRGDDEVSHNDDDEHDNEDRHDLPVDLGL